jgi:hypothetical protein
MARRAALSGAEQGMQVHPNIVRAVAQRSLLRINYCTGYLIVEPHAYGVTNKGVKLLYCYHVSSNGALEDGEGWKLLRVGDIVDAYVISQHFPSARAGYQSGLSALRMKLYCSL